MGNPGRVRSKNSPRSQRNGEGKKRPPRRRRRDEFPDDEDFDVIPAAELEQTKTALKLADLKNQPAAQLVELAQSMDLESLARSRKQDMIFSILKAHAKKGENIYGEGVLEILQDGFGFLRSADSSYLAGPDDIYVSPSQIRRLSLRTGDTVSGLIRPPKDNERYFAMLRVGEINHDAPENARNKVLFENLTPLFPTDRLKLEQGNGSTEDLTARVIDMVAPIGKGQRGLIVSPPKAGKTMLLQNIAASIVANQPECDLIVLLIDERPEEVTEMERTVRGEVVSSTFDEPATRHVQVAEMVIEKAKRLTEHKRDVVILAGFDHAVGAGLQYGRSLIREGAHRWRGCQRAAAPEAVFRGGPEYRGGRQPHDHRHRARGHRFEDGRGHLRRVQGHRQHGNPPGPADFGKTRFPVDTHQSLRHAQGGTPDSAGRVAEDVGAAEGPALHGRIGCRGVSAGQAAGYQDERHVLLRR